MSQEVNTTTAPSTTAATQIFSVEQVNNLLRGLIETNVGTVWIKGEISNFKPHSSGHFYFSLKDSKAQISAMMFRGYNSKLKFKPHDGLEVIVRGKITVYEPRGTYSIACEMMEPVGAGALQKQFEQLRDKLKTEGLFDPARKQPIPTYPKTVAIVTSPTGAAIQDILNIMNRRARGVQVIVVPAIVQGAAAAPSLVEAFKKAEAINPDVIIIGRGGGSIEDMWCFNDERLARTIADSKIPVISAVGHEIDFTICDFVADLRAPTPSAAAELVAKSSVEIINKLEQLERLLRLAIQRRLQHKQQSLLLQAKRLVDPKKKLQDLFIRNDDLYSRMDLAMTNYLSHARRDVQLLRSRLVSPKQVIEIKKVSLQQRQQKLSNSLAKNLTQYKFRVESAMALLDSLSPLKVVDRGYSITTKGKDVVKSVKQVKVGDLLAIKVADGTIEVEVKNIK
ncbi:exodeoxyribonuclease VII large subunit [Bdellovibrio sp. qaytius]|nr:exodeoxyribonuclease VII large subunit [Bdellovibrio sp. qaytius]